MARINLLPWRAERREQRKREFFMQLGIAAAAAIAVVILAILFMDARIASQNSDNDYLTGEIKQLDAKIAEIKDLQKTKSQLLARKQIIEKLQENRAQMVHLFDELVKTIPDGARLTSLKQNGPTLTLDGVAQSNATVAEYMRNIEGSPWLGSTDLVKTENKRSDSRTPYEFELVVHLDKPSARTVAGPAAEGSTGSGPAGTPNSAASVTPAVPAKAAPTTSDGAAAMAKPVAPVSKGGAAQ
jgi:type IV pilus assembly protein PilN